MRPWFAFAALPALFPVATAQDPARNPPLHVAYVGDPDGARGKAFVGFLKAQFPDVVARARGRTHPEDLRLADVVVLDWDQQDGVIRWMDREHPMAQGGNPLGELARWDRPTLLLGSSGLNVAADWSLPGSYG